MNVWVRVCVCVLVGEDTPFLLVHVGQGLLMIKCVFTLCRSHSELDESK